MTSSDAEEEGEGSATLWSATARVGFATAIFILLALVAAYAWHLQGVSRVTGRQFTFLDALVLGTSDWVSVTLMLIAGVYLGAQQSARPVLKPKHLVLAFGGLLLAVLGGQTVRYCARIMIFTRTPSLDLFVARHFPAAFVVALPSMALGYGMWRMRREQEQASALARLEAELARAKFASAHVGLRTDYLIHALERIGAIVPLDIVAAENAVLHFAELLRLLLHRGTAGWVTLRSEISLVRAQLALERSLGHEVGLTVRVGSDAETTFWPSNSLLTLLDTVICVPDAQLPSRLEVTAERNGQRSTLSIWDDGVSTVVERERRPTWAALKELEAVLSSHPGPRAVVSLEPHERGLLITLCAWDLRTKSEQEGQLTT